MHTGSITDDRVELKLRIDPRHADALLAAVAAHVPEHHFDPQRPDAATAHHHITTVYLDTPSRALYRAVSKDEGSLKVRVREYYDVDSTATITRTEPVTFIELKTKESGRTRKRRTGVARDALVPLLEQGDVGAGTHDPVLAELLRVRSRLSEPLVPSCAVNYRRTAFQNADASLRVTLDREVTFFAGHAEQLASASVLSRAALGEPASVEPYCVVEIKFKTLIPTWLQHVINTMQGDASPFSKFVAASRVVHGAPT